jgi:hypothetical protein
VSRSQRSRTAASGWSSICPSFKIMSDHGLEPNEGRLIRTPNRPPTVKAADATGVESALREMLTRCDPLIASCGTLVLTVCLA